MALDWRDERIAELEAALTARDERIAKLEQLVAELTEQLGRSSSNSHIGNLHEWVSDTVDRRLPLKLPLRDDIRDKIRVNTGKGIFMGGFYSTTSEHGRGCAFVTIAHEPKYHDYSTGFRCCRDAGVAPPSQ